MTMEVLADWVSRISNVVWNGLLLYLLVGTGIVFTIRTRFIQVRKFGAGWKHLFGHFSLNGEKAGKDGMSPFQALTTAIAAQVGTGNIAGAATALYSGGPGAIFWMWLSAFFGMSTIYGEAVLAQKYKTFGAPMIVVGIICAIIAAFIFLGGVGRIASVTEKVVPIMALFYMAGCIVILCINHAAIIPAFKSIFVAAFDPQAILGGAAGITVRQAMRYGVARGLFSNEAGMGSTPHAHALAKVNRPQDQGEIAIVSVFIDTFIVLTLTAMVILTSGMLNPGAPDGLQGTELAQAAFKASLGSAGMAFVAICMLFFAFSTIIGWYFFGEQNVKALFGHKAVKVYAAIVVICIVIGSALHVDLVWNLSDLFNGLMVFPNLIALLALSGLVAKAAHDKDIMK